MTLQIAIWRSYIMKITYLGTDVARSKALKTTLLDAYVKTTGTCEALNGNVEK